MEASDQINSVVNNLSSQIGNAITALADQLKVPVEQVLGIMVKQAYVHGVTNVLYIVICFSIVIFSMFYIFKNKKGVYLFEGPFYIAIGLGVVSIGCLFMIFGLLDETLTCLFNPEYWVMQEIINMVTTS